MCQKNLWPCFQTTTGASLGVDWLVPNVFLGLFPLAGAPQEFSKETAVTHTSSGSMGAQNPHPGSLSSESSLSTSAYLQTNDGFFLNNRGKGKTTDTYGIMYSCLENSSILAWKIPWAEEPSWLQSMGPQRVRHDWVSEQTHYLLIVIRQPVSPTHSAGTSLQPTFLETHITSIFMPRGSVTMLHKLLFIPTSQRQIISSGPSKVSKGKSFPSVKLRQTQLSKTWEQ